MKFYKVFLALVLITLILQACGNGSGETTSTPPATEPIVSTQSPVVGSTATAAPTADFFAPIPFRSGKGFRGPWLELYFTDPSSPLAAHEVGGVDAFLAASIAAAKESVDVALRSLTLDSVTKALVLAHDRGLPVRVITDTDSLTNRSKFQVLQSAGIPVVDDQQDGIMNNRFVIIDHREVWTGSLNFDTTGVFREDAVLVRIFSEDLAKDYTKEFDEMFVDKQFGMLVVPETPIPNVTIQGTQVEVLFSPDDLVVNRLTQLVNDAKESVYFLSFAFANEDFGKVIRDKAAQGVKVSGVLDYDQVNPNNAVPNPNQIAELDLFRQAGLDIRLDGGPEALNHKFIIIDSKIVVTGSYDFTNRAELENDENVLTIHNEFIAQEFMEEFLRIQAMSQK